MDSTAAIALREIGLQLDQGLFPVVKDGGLVVPSGSGIPIRSLGQEQCNGYTEGSRRPSAGSRKRPSGREGKASGSRAPGAAAPLIVAAVGSRYEAELDDVKEAYPGAKLWHQGGGFWLLTESRLLAAELEQNAIFLTVFSLEHLAARSWGFWRAPLPSTYTWIGPRHTNYPDGSVCAFTPQDETWIFGDRIVPLLDLYSVWAVRQLHLKIFGRWPGSQFVPERFERLVELRQDEMCGCGHPTGAYGQCCRPHDLAECRVKDGITYQLQLGARQPPPAVSRFVQELGEPPSLESIFGGH